MSVQESRDWLQSLEARERKRTGIRGLRVGWNARHGYYIEISDAALQFGEIPVPDGYEVIYQREGWYAKRYRMPEIAYHERMVGAPEPLEGIA